MLGARLFRRGGQQKGTDGTDVEDLIAQLKANDSRSKWAQISVAKRLAALKDAKDVEQCQPAVRPLLKLLKAGQPEVCQEAAALAVHNLTASCPTSNAVLAKRKWQRKAVLRLVGIASNGSAATQAAAAKALHAIAALGDSSRLQVALSGAAKPLVDMLRDDGAEDEGAVKSGGKRESAARCLREIAINPSACRLLDGSGVQEALSALLSSQSPPSVQEAAAWALCTIACSPEQQARLIGEDGGMQELVALIREGSPAADAAVWVLHNLCAVRGNVPRLVEGGVVHVMVDALYNRGDLAREAAARTLSNCAWHSGEYAKEVVAAGALPPLLHVLCHGTRYSKVGAAMALCQIALWEDNIDALHEHRHELTHQLSRLLTPSTQPSSGAHTTSLQEVAASALQNMAANPTLRRVILDEPSLVGRLVALLSTGTAVAAVESAGALMNLCSLPPSKTMNHCGDAENDAAGELADACHSLTTDAVGAVLAANGETYLVRMLDEPAYTASAAAAAIRALSRSSLEGCQAVVRAGCVQAFVATLQRMQQVVTVAKSSVVEPDVWCTVESSAGSLADLILQTEYGAASSAVPPLTKLLLPSAPAGATLEICRAIAAITQRSDAQRSKLARRGSRVVSRLADVLTRRLHVDANARAAAADALCILASDGNAARSAVASSSASVLQSLVSMLSPGAATVEKIAAATTLGELARGHRLHALLLEAGVETALEEVSEFGTDGEREAASVALNTLHHNANPSDIASSSLMGNESVSFWQAEVDLDANHDSSDQNGLLASTGHIETRNHRGVPPITLLQHGTRKHTKWQSLEIIAAAPWRVCTTLLSRLVLEVQLASRGAAGQMSSTRKRLAYSRCEM